MAKLKFEAKNRLLNNEEYFGLKVTTLYSLKTVIHLRNKLDWVGRSTGFLNCIIHDPGWNKIY